MDDNIVFPDPERLKALEITRAYAEYKTRYIDLERDLINWTTPGVWLRTKKPKMSHEPTRIMEPNA
jgi:hypothetical protein